TPDLHTLSLHDALPISSEGAATPFEKRPPADRWLLARLDEVVGEVRRAWSDYDVTAGVRGIMDFVGEDLSRWYTRRNRPRFWARSEEHTSELQSPYDLV